MTQASFPGSLLKWLRPQLPRMLKTLGALVRAESPSTEKMPADACAKILAADWCKRGAQVELHPQKHRGTHIRAIVSSAAAKSRGQLLVLGHYDTVYSSGTLAKMPFCTRNGRAFGPGVFDMKAGLVQALFALDAIQNLRLALAKRIVFLWTSDEEIGSESSRKLIETEAKRSDAVFVLEPSLGPKGLLKTARKGVGEAQIIIHGRSSHAGLAPDEGVNAIHELALQLSLVRKWNDPQRGVSVNADLVSGGTRVNVIPDSARAVIDLRALRVVDMRAIESRLHALRPILPGAKLEVSGGFNRPPLERKSSASLFLHASSLAKQMGLTIGECRAGGGSDGNLTAALGIPTLDGLGAVGDHAHSPREYIFTRNMPERAALLSALLLSS